MADISARDGHGSPIILHFAIHALALADSGWPSGYMGYCILSMITPCYRSAIDLRGSRLWHSMKAWGLSPRPRQHFQCHTGSSNEPRRARTATRKRDCMVVVASRVGGALFKGSGIESTILNRFFPLPLSNRTVAILPALTDFLQNSIEKCLFDCNLTFNRPQWKCPRTPASMRG